MGVSTLGSVIIRSCRRRGDLMPYSQGNVSGANPGTDLQAAFKTALTGAGWTFVENAVNGSINADVYKSPAASNSFGQDFYVSFVNSVASPTYPYMSLRPHEGYDVVNHKMQKYAPTSTGLTPVAGTYLNPQADLHPANTAVLAGYLQQYSDNMYYLSVTMDRVVLAFRSRYGSWYSWYCGLYTPLLAADPFPLLSITLNAYYSNQSYGYGSATREWGQAASNQYNFFVQFYGSSTYDTLGPSTDGSDVYRPGVAATYAYPLHYLTPHSSRDPYYTRRGVLKDVWYYYGSNGALVGDTVQIGGVTYTKLGGYPGPLVSQAV